MESNYEETNNGMNGDDSSHNNMILVDPQNYDSFEEFLQALDATVTDSGDKDSINTYQPLRMQAKHVQIEAGKTMTIPIPITKPCQVSWKISVQAKEIKCSLVVERQQIKGKDVEEENDDQQSVAQQETIMSCQVTAGENDDDEDIENEKEPKGNELEDITETEEEHQEEEEEEEDDQDPKHEEESTPSSSSSGVVTLKEPFPATVILSFDNSYSWFTAKHVSYQITVTPKLTPQLIGRRNSAQAALELVQPTIQYLQEEKEQIQHALQELEPEWLHHLEAAKDCYQTVQSTKSEFERVNTLLEKQQEQAQNLELDYQQTKEDYQETQHEIRSIEKEILRLQQALGEKKQHAQSIKVTIDDIKHQMSETVSSINEIQSSKIISVQTKWKQQTQELRTAKQIAQEHEERRQTLLDKDAKLDMKLKEFQKQVKELQSRIQY
jgi:hypothetical protein